MRVILTPIIVLSLAALALLMPQWNTPSAIVFAAVCVFFLTVLASVWTLDHAQSVTRVGACMLAILLLSGAAYALNQGPSTQSGTLLIGCVIGGIPALFYAITGRPRLLQTHPSDEWDTDDPWDGEYDDVLSDEDDRRRS